MSGKGNPYDNADCESFMKTLKYEEVYRQEYRDLEEARSCIEQFMEKVYNQKRLHSALGYRPPVEFEQALSSAATTGAWSMSVTHCAPRGRENSTREGAPQIIVGVTVTTGKMRTSEPKNVLDLSGRRSLRQQVPGDPQIDDAPVRLRKALCDAPSLHTTPVDLDGLHGGDSERRSLLPDCGCATGSVGEARVAVLGPSP